MTEGETPTDASALDAIESLAREGIQRNSPGKRAFILGAFIIALFGCAVAGWLQWNKKSAELAIKSEALTLESQKVVALEKALQAYDKVELAEVAEWPVAVMLPRVDEGAVKENAARQLEGFNVAFAKHSATRNIYHFNYPLTMESDPATSAENINALMEQIKTWYHEDGIRTFVITMSGAVMEIKTRFADFANELPTQNDHPVLVATVASAPDIADRENGIFRHYIRSRDESSMFATYVESRNADEVYVFYVGDAYGVTAKKILEERLKRPRFRPFRVEVQFDEAAENQVTQDVMTILKETASKNTVVVIVGYGQMIARTLEILRDAKGREDEKYAGKILVVSTFTENDWRPDDLKANATRNSQFAGRIHTVVPVHAQKDYSKNPGVVYQFAYLTLDRALQCKGRRGRDAFWKCWSNPKIDQRHLEKEIPSVEVEFTADGDSHISLRLLNHFEW